MTMPIDWSKLAFGTFIEYVGEFCNPTTDWPLTTSKLDNFFCRILPIPICSVWMSMEVSVRVVSWSRPHEIGFAVDPNVWIATGPILPWNWRCEWWSMYQGMGMIQTLEINHSLWIPTETHLFNSCFFLGVGTPKFESDPQSLTSVP